MNPIKILNENDAVRHLASATYAALILGLLKNKRTYWEAATFAKICEMLFGYLPFYFVKTAVAAKTFQQAAGYA